MKFLKAYLTALKFNSIVLGTAFFVYSVLLHLSLVAEYIFYVCIVSSIAGPIKLFIDHRKKT